MKASAALVVSARPLAPVIINRIPPLVLWFTGVLGIALVAAIAVIAATGMTVEWSGFARFLTLAAALAGLWLWSRQRGLDSRVGDAALVVAIGTLSLLICGVISNAGLRLGAPTIDGTLAEVDAMFGIRVDEAVRAFAAHPVAIDLLAKFYNISGAVAVGLIALAIARRQRALRWELVATVVAAMQVVALISIAMPAVGAMVHFGMLDLQGKSLPIGAGVYHLEAFEYFRSGSDRVLRLSDMGGVVTFPSFHTVLALIATQALAATRARWVGVVFTAVVIVSTIPIGGHYVTDLVAGFLIWVACAWMAKRISSPSG